MLRLLRSRPVAFSAAAAAVGLAAFGLAFAAPNGEPTPAAPGESAPEATPSPVVSPAPLPTAWPTPVAKPSLPAPLAPPSGPADLPPLAVEPVRVHTGDGDCLNVRPLPGIPPSNDRPRDCLPEGTLLWLAGPAIDADGETWRRALGMGWVASRYTRPEPKVSAGFGPFESAIVLASPSAFQTDWAQAVRVTPSGAAPASAWLPFNPAWAGMRHAPLSPDGRYLAFVSYQPDDRPRAAVVEVQGGDLRDLPALPVSWGPGSRLLLKYPDLCDTCAGAYAIAGPPFTDPRPLPALGPWPLAWLPDGEHVVAWDASSGIHLAGTDGTSRVTPAALPDGAWPGELAVSPSGRYLLAVPYTGPIRLVDLETGALTTFDRRDPGPIGGRCGGSLATVAWLDDRTFAYHEAILGPGENGIILVNRETGARRRLPFGNVFELRAAGPGLLAFTTIDYPGKDDLQGAAPPAVSWLYDPSIDFASPAAPGLFATWQ